MKLRGWNRRLDNWEVGIVCKMGNWNLLADEKPANGTSCEFAHIPSDYPSTRGFGTWYFNEEIGNGGVVSIPQGTFVSDHKETYWRAI